jgi:uncharacterized protein YggE
MMRALVMAILAAFGGAAGAAAADNRDALVPSITVVGEGKASARPDMAEVQVGVVTQATTASQALKDNNAAMGKLFKALSGQGIADKDIQTSSFQVMPQYRQDKEGRELAEPAGYHVTNLVRVKVRDLAKLGAVLDEVIAQGANRVHGVSFSVADPEAILDGARKQALADAQRKADLYAKAAGRKVGRILLIQEQSPQLPHHGFIGFAREKLGAVPVAPGEMDFQANVTVTFALD